MYKKDVTRTHVFVHQLEKSCFCKKMFLLKNMNNDKKKVFNKIRTLTIRDSTNIAKRSSKTKDKNHRNLDDKLWNFINFER